MTHDFSGRKRKNVKGVWSVKNKRPPPSTKPLKASHQERERLDRMEEDRVKYPSMMERMVKDGTFHKAGDKCTVKTEDYKQEVSSQYTIAPAYNKGAYQVVPKSDLKHIGK